MRLAAGYLARGAHLWSRNLAPALERPDRPTGADAATDNLITWLLAS